MKRILISLSLIGAVAAIAVTATRAYFSDTETSAGNTFTAGTLDLKVDGADNPLPVKFTLENLKPTDEDTITYDVNNAGSIAGYLNLANISLVDTEGLNPESETNTEEPGDLSPHINVVVTFGEDEPFYDGPLSGLAAYVAANSANFALAAGESSTVTIAWNWPSSETDNDAMGDISTVGMDFQLTQNSIGGPL